MGYLRKCTWFEPKRLESPAYSGRGFFHTWGSRYEDFETGPCNFSVAVIEDESGKVHSIPVEQVTFDDWEKPDDPTN